MRAETRAAGGLFLRAVTRAAGSPHMRLKLLRRATRVASPALTKCSNRLALRALNR